MGVVGRFRNNPANRYLSESDFVYAVGCGLNSHTTDEGRLRAEGTTVLDLDSTPDSLGKCYGADLGIAGDAQATTPAFESELAGLGIDFSDSFCAAPQVW